MTHDCISDDFPRFVSRRGERFTVLQTDPYGLVSVPGWRYTTRSKSKSFRLAVPAPYHPLERLKAGKAVQLFMELPPLSRRPVKSSSLRSIPVVVVPGPSFGSFDGAYLVAVIGRGSAVLTPFATSNISSLVTAGMPARLATYLVKEISNLVWSQHATRQSPPRRPVPPRSPRRRSPSADRK